MSKLNQEKLLGEFEKAYGHHPTSVKNEQAYQQIKELIQKPEVTIEAIIEIVLDNVSCDHEKPDPAYPGRVGSFATYSLDNEQEVIKKCLKLKPEADESTKFMNNWLETLPFDREEFIEKAARAIHDEVYNSKGKCGYKCNLMGSFRIQIRKIIEKA